MEFSSSGGCDSKGRVSSLVRMNLNDSVVEDAALSWFEEVGYGVEQALRSRNLPTSTTSVKELHSAALLSGASCDGLARNLRDSPRTRRSSALPARRSRRRTPIHSPGYLVVRSSDFARKTSTDRPLPASPKNSSISFTLS